ncbi:MAG: D-alanyl-D-alanine carboxypeptidase family protein [Kiritimatiellia bacterium]
MALRTMLAIVAAGALQVAAVPPVKRGPLINGPAPAAVRRTADPSAPAKAPAKTAAKKKAAPRPSAAKAPAASAAKSAPPPADPGRGPLAPYRGAIAVDADTGRVLFADHADRTGYPASVTKLMTLLLVLEDLAQGRYKLTDRAVASAYAASQEPSKVDLRQGQSMTIDDLLFAIMTRSANDAAVVLAEHSARHQTGAKAPPRTAAGSAELLAGFVDRMNRRARQLGMRATRYASPNGLPPAPGSKRGFDTSTASDLALLGRAVVLTPGALKYTSAPHCTVTDGNGKKLVLQNHNYFVPKNPDPKRLCEPLPECDGLKTGFTTLSGSSIVLTAKRNGRRVIVVVLGSAGRHEREAAAGRLLRDALNAVSVW